MTFRRTSTGLSNLHLFIDAEAVVFLEGGMSITREEVEHGKFTSRSSDIRYWQTLFMHYMPKRKLQFRSVGSKEIVKSIARDIKNGSINNVVAVMDRDYDNLSNSIIDSENIIYTYGYSWENDCWSEKTITDAVISLTGLCSTKVKDVESEVCGLFKRFRHQIKQAVKADSLMIQNGCFFFDREKPARYIHVQSDGKPEACASQLKQSFSDSRTRVGSPIFRKAELAHNPIYDCFGHLFAYFSYRVLYYLLKSVYKLPVVAKKYATTVIVDKYVSAFSAGVFPNLKAHYDQSFGRITA